ncbi:MAG: hypothetical protein ACE5NC_05765 [Anaerolineae bacterium]
MKWCASVLSAVVILTAGVPAFAAGLDPFFSCSAIVFFGPCPDGNTHPGRPADGETKPQELATAIPARAAPREPDKPAEPPQEESIWAEPVRGPDGKLRVYLPPKPVRDFLDKPTPAAAKAYIKWNRKRISAIRRAATVMHQVVAEEGIIAPPSPGFETSFRPLVPVPDAPELPSGIEIDQRVTGAREPKRLSVIYAFATWCPHSKRQTPIMSQLATRIPVQGIAFDSPPDAVEAVRRIAAFPVRQGTTTLRQRLGVESYPTVLFLNGQEIVHRTSGVHSMKQLSRVLAALAGQRARPPVLDPGRAEPCAPQPAL